MCGRFNLIDSPEIQWLCKALGISLLPKHENRDIAPGSTIAIVHNVSGARQVSDAIWWLLLNHETLKPNYKYATFNSRYDKLLQKRSISYLPYRESRCIIPASAFIEGLGDKKTYHKIELQKSAIAFGGLYKEYFKRETGEIVYSASIITLPPLVPQWNDIHPNSMPLMLDFEDEELADKWLDPNFHEVEEFKSLLVNHVQKDMVITRVGRPSKWNPIADSFIIRR